MTWQEHAACKDKPRAWFFPGPNEHPDAARLVCRTCPVKPDCLEYAVTFPEPLHGVWGGTTVKERRALRRDAVQVKPRPRCGTEAGYAWHCRHDGLPCASCLIAHRIAAAARKAERVKRQREAVSRPWTKADELDAQHLTAVLERAHRNLDLREKETA